jgi:hypothetical protein
MRDRINRLLLSQQLVQPTSRNSLFKEAADSSKPSALKDDRTISLTATLYHFQQPVYILLSLHVACTILLCFLLPITHVFFFQISILEMNI